MGSFLDVSPGILRSAEDTVIGIIIVYHARVVGLGKIEEIPWEDLFLRHRNGSVPALLRKWVSHPHAISRRNPEVT